MIPVETGTKTELDAFALAGGLDLVTSALQVPSGRLLACQNYEPDLNGGYRRAGAYERFDGRSRPSQATYASLACTLTATLAVGDLVSAGGVTGTYVGALSDGILLANPSGTFAGSTAMTVGATPVGTTAADPVSSYGSTVLEDAQARSDVADYLRTLIAAVPGSGPVRGVTMYEGTVYAFRNNAGGTAGVMHKSTTSGWSAITMPYELTFTAGATAWVAGETVKGNTSTATGTVLAVVLETGAWGAAGTGRLIITPLTGTFQASESLRGSSDAYGANRATCSGAAAQVTIAPGGNYRFLQRNFTGRATGLKLYGVSGVDRPFEFDGTYYVPLNTGISGTYASQIAESKRYLFLGYGASLLNSSVGNPYRYVSGEGAAETTVGEAITDLKDLSGEALGIFTRNRSLQLVGSSPSTWTLQPIADDVGAVANTVQTVGATMALDDRGVVSTAASDTYGNFEQATISRQVQPVIDAMRSLAVTSCVVRQRNLYRIFCSSGFVLSVLPAKESAFGSLKLGITPACAWSGEDSTGVERIFVGASNGFVYEMDVGTSQDGTAVEAFFRTVYASSKSPRTRKRYRKLILDVTPVRYSTLSVSAELSFGTAEIRPVPVETAAVGGSGGSWNVSNWDAFYWDAQDISQAEIGLTGTGLNLGVTVYQNTKLDAGHVVQSGIVHYTSRRLQR